VPAGTYRVSPGPGGSAIPITRASTRLVLEDGASILLDPGDLPGASIISISAPDVTIEGGTLIGDLAGPQLRDGEWGHGIVVGRGGDRSVLSNVAVVRCWGDGIYLGGGAQDVAVLDCTADGNRRQGLSIVSAVRPLVRGGKFVNTGKYGRALPGAGIDVEPNPLRGEAVVDATIRDVELSGNTGPGLLVVGLGGRAEVEVERSVMERNASPGVTVLGRGASLSLTSCTSRSNHTGYLVEDTAGPVRISDCVAERNAAQGFLLKAPATGLIGCTASDNAGSGVEFAVTARACTLTQCTVVGNSVNGIPVPEIEIWAPATRLEKVVVRAGSPTRATYGISLRPSSAGTQVIDTSAPVGFPPGRAVNDLRPRAATG
jgi:nitrous oxidase accessory protein NosD